MKNKTISDNFGKIIEKVKSTDGKKSDLDEILRTINHVQQMLHDEMRRRKIEKIKSKTENKKS